MRRYLCFSNNCFPPTASSSSSRGKEDCFCYQIFLFFLFSLLYGRGISMTIYRWSWWKKVVGFGPTFVRERKKRREKPPCLSEGQVACQTGSYTFRWTRNFHLGRKSLSPAIDGFFDVAFSR